MPDISIIIPVFNHAALTKQCLDAVLRTAGAAEVIVTDDASTDDTAAVLRGFGERIKTLRHETNLGFALSCNDGAALASGRHLVFLNNDTVPQPGWLEALVKYADAFPRAALIGSKLLYPDNTIQHAGVVICQDRYPRHIYSGFPADHPAVCKSRRFQLVTAACILVRREVFQNVGGFDTGYRNGFEDVDLCLRLGELGHEIHYCAESVVHHLESVSPGRFRHDGDNVRLYRERWFAKVEPDDLRYFIEDGLLELNYEGRFPLHLKIAPELAVVDAARGGALEKTLAAKSRHIADLSREVAKLRVELGQSNPTSEALRLERKREEIRAQARMATPPEAKILVVSKGDHTLLELDGRDAQHFPQAADGIYLGHHPADSAEAIARLDALRERGAEYLLFPATSFWWLEHYADFTWHLENVGSLVQRNRECVIYALRRVRLAKPERAARVIALLATYNEERFIGNCLKHLIAQGVQVHLLDNDSTDRTVAIAETFLGRGLLAIERLPRHGEFNLDAQLAARLARVQTLEADWFIHVDADEMPLCPVGGLTLAEGLAAAAAAGYDAVNFQEFTFIPTAESSDHDHPDFVRTMRWYYPFLPSCPWGIRAIQRTAVGKITEFGMHQPVFKDMRLCPLFFVLRHYQFLSVAQAGKKYSRSYARAELDAGHHGGHQGWRALFRAEDFPLPAQAELRELRPDGELDATSPRLVHVLDERIQALVRKAKP